MLVQLKNRISRLLALLLLTFATGAQSADWQKIEIPVNENLSGISFLNRDTGILVTQYGRYLLTEDAGKNWNSYSEKPPVALEDIDFYSEKVAAICGRGGRLYITTTGLDGWQNVSLPDTTPWLLDVEMFDDTTGLVIGTTRNPDNFYEGLTLRTTDGGKTWNPLTQLGYGLAQIQVADDGTVMVLSFGKLSESKDKGFSWTSHLTFDGEPCRTFSMHGQHGIMGGLNGMCAYTEDRGQTWNIARQNLDYVLIASAMVSDKVGYLGGSKGVLIRTDDGGANWTQETLPETFDIFDMQLVGNRLFIVGTEGHMLYKDLK